MWIQLRRQLTCRGRRCSFADGTFQPWNSDYEDVKIVVDDNNDDRGDCYDNEDYEDGNIDG